jgi:hypothetical protein
MLSRLEGDRCGSSARKKVGLEKLTGRYWRVIPEEPHSVALPDNLDLPYGPRSAFTVCAAQKFPRFEYPASLLFQRESNESTS